ncbi:unnamed protein product, partial [Tilletia controversa]
TSVRGSADLGPPSRKHPPSSVSSNTLALFTPQGASALLFFASFLRLTPIITQTPLFTLPVTCARIFSDASEWGLGITLGDAALSLPFDPAQSVSPFSIVWAEALAFEIALRIAIHRGISDSNLVIHCDNAAVVATAQTGYMRNQQVMLVLQRIRQLEASANIEVAPVFTRSEDNPADSYSRGLRTPSTFITLPDLPIEITQFLPPTCLP